MSAIRFHCIHCGSEHSAADSRDERLIECPKCRHTVPVPAPSALADGPEASAFPRGVLALEMKFLCTGCGVKLGIDARWEGRSIHCPACKSIVQIPRWSRRREPGSGISLTAEEIAFLSEEPARLRTA